MSTALLHLMAQQLGIDGFGYDADGRKQLVFDGDLVVVFDDTARRDGVWLVAEIVHVPTIQRRDFLHHVLRLNGIEVQQLGPIMVLETDRILLQEFWSTDTITNANIIIRLERFLNTAERWKNTLQNIQKQNHPRVDLWENVFRP